MLKDQSKTQNLPEFFEKLSVKIGDGSLKMIRNINISSDTLEDVFIKLREEEEDIRF